MSTILIIEDDNDINQMVAKLLKHNGYEVISAYSGTEGVLVHNENVDLILLDLMLPGKSGDEIIGDLKEKKKVPIIVMSAISDINKKVDLLMLGADDYVTKPFSNEELLARVAVRLRESAAINNSSENGSSSNTKEKNIIKYKDIEVDNDDFTASCNGKDLELAKHEFLLLQLLVKNNNKTCTKSMIYDIVWDYEDSADDNTLNVHISKLRKKLKECNPAEDYIETVWGIGYRMKK